MLIDDDNEYYDMGRKNDSTNSNRNKRKKYSIWNRAPLGFKIPIYILCGILILGFCLRCVYSVNEQSNAVVTQFGQPIRVDTAGFYFRFPWQNVRKVDITTHGTGIGYDVSDSGQNIVNLTDGVMITSDFNLLNIDFYMEYRVSDPIAYLYNSENPEAILSNVALANIRTVVSNYDVDSAMTTGKGQIQADVKDGISKWLSEHNIGLSIVNITIQDSDPPTQQIMAAFKAVETAKQDAEVAINDAKKYQNEHIPSARAEADSIIQNANATKDSRIAEANGQVERFNKMYEEYIKYPLVTKQRMFYEKMEELLPGMKVVITDGNTQSVLPVDSFNITGVN